MRRPFIPVLMATFIVLTIAASFAAAQDYTSGAALFNEHCSRCHGTIDLDDIEAWSDPLGFSSKIVELAEAGQSLDDYFQEKYGLSTGDYIASEMAPLSGYEFTPEEIEDLVALFQHIYEYYSPTPTETSPTATTPTPTETTPSPTPGQNTTTGTPGQVSVSIVTVTETVKVVQTKTVKTTITKTDTLTTTKTYVLKETVTEIALGELRLTVLVLGVATIIGISVIIASRR